MELSADGGGRAAESQLACSHFIDDDIGCEYSLADRVFRYLFSQFSAVQQGYLVSVEEVLVGKDLHQQEGRVFIAAGRAHAK